MVQEQGSDSCPRTRTSKCCDRNKEEEEEEEKEQEEGEEDIDIAGRIVPIRISNQEQPLTHHVNLLVVQNPKEWADENDDNFDRDVNHWT